MGMFGSAMGTMVGAGGGGHPNRPLPGGMQQRPGMPVQNQNPGMMGQNNQAMTGARTAAMRNPMNPGLGQGMMGPSQQMQQKMMPQQFPGQQMGNMMGQMKGQQQGPDYNGPRIQAEYGGPAGKMPMWSQYPQMGRGFVGGPPLEGNDMGPGGISGNPNMGIQPGPTQEAVPGAEQQMNDKMARLNAMYGGGQRNQMQGGSPMGDPRMRNFR